MTLDHICARLLISGKVQGVGFRIALRDQARQVGVVGWVRNTPDGYVEAYLEGGNAAVRRIISWCYGGPPQAQVERVQVQWQEPERTLTDFMIEYT